VAVWRGLSKMAWRCKRCDYHAFKDGENVMDLVMHLLIHGFPILYPHDAIKQFRHVDIDEAAA
jgi:hypothetical protein